MRSPLYMYLKIGFALIIFSLLTIHCENALDTAENISQDDPPIEFNDYQQAAENYKIHCSGCHGKKLNTFVERNWVYGNSYENILHSINVGYVDNGMPAYGVTFTEEELQDLVNYIISETEGITKEMLLNDNPDLSEIIQSNDMKFRTETLTKGINGTPWGLAQLPNGEILVTEKEGRLFLITNEQELLSISGIPNSKTTNQGGLLDIELHPDFENNNYIYFSYTKSNPNNASQNTTAVARARFKDNQLTDLEDIFIAEPYINSALHYGSRLQFDRNGFLYVSVGDRGETNDYPQNLNNHCGKVHRLNDDGSIPDDNPFVNTPNALPSIYAYGIRNPQGLAIHPATGAIWEGEHGPQGGDEINIIEAGNNYGWPIISYGINYDGSILTEITEQEGMEQPIHYWVPSIAPCGMDFVSGNFYPNWKNDLFVSSLKFEYLHRLKMDGNTVVGQEELLQDIGRVRDVLMGNDGFIYIAVQNPGRVIRLLPEN
jgi:glucose/arabinose dehydrogenase